MVPAKSAGISKFDCHSEFDQVHRRGEKKIGPRARAGTSRGDLVLLFTMALSNRTRAVNVVSGDHARLECQACNNLLG